MNINWWRVVAYALLALSFTGLIVGLTLDTGGVSWALASLVTYGIVRLEWFIAALAEAKESDDGQQEPDGYSP